MCARAMDKPMHRVEDVGLRGTKPWVRRVVGHHLDVVVLVAVVCVISP